MASREPLDYPVFQAFDANGAPLSSGTVEFFDAGTTDQRNTYSDPDLTTTNPNPVTLNSRGEPESGGGTAINIYLDNQPYKIVLKDSSGSTIRTVDNYIGSSPITVPQDPADASVQTTDDYEGVLSRDPEANEVFTVDFQSANTTTTPTFENTNGSLGALTMKTKDGSALWASAVSGIHDIQYDGTDYLVLEPNPSQQRDLARLATASLRGDVAAFHDEDDMASDDATGVASQQSVKAFVGAQKISTGSFSGASVDISLPTGYDQHILVVNALQPATDATNLQARLDSVSSANSYEFEALVADAGTVAAGRTLTTQMNLIEDLSNADEEIATMTLEIYGARNTGARTMLQARSQYMASDSAINLRIHVAQRTAEEDDTILNLFMSSGNFSTGTYTLYGMR